MVVYRGKERIKGAYECNTAKQQSTDGVTEHLILVDIFKARISTDK